MSVEKESGDERQTVKQVQKKKEGESDREKKDSHQMCSLCTQALVQGRQRGKLLLLIYVLILSSALQSLFSSL